VAAAGGTTKRRRGLADASSMQPRPGLGSSLSIPRRTKCFTGVARRAPSSRIPYGLLFRVHATHHGRRSVSREAGSKGLATPGGAGRRLAQGISTAPLFQDSHPEQRQLGVTSHQAEDCVCRKQVRAQVERALGD